MKKKSLESMQRTRTESPASTCWANLRKDKRLDIMDANLTKATANDRTFVSPTWHEERDIWEADTVSELRDRIAQQVGPFSLETPWQLVEIRLSAYGRAVAVVRREVYCDTSSVDALLVGISEKYGRPNLE